MLRGENYNSTEPGGAGTKERATKVQYVSPMMNMQLTSTNKVMMLASWEKNYMLTFAQRMGLDLD